MSLALVSCAGRKPLPPVTIEKTKTITEVVKDTIYKVEADSSYYYAYVECINGKPVIKEPVFNQDQKLPENRSGKNLQTPKVSLTGNVLSVQCYQQAQELFKQWRETYIREQEKKTVPKYVEKPINWHLRILMYLGGIFIFICILAIILKIKS